MEFSFQFLGIAEITLQHFHETEMIVSSFFIGGLMRWVYWKPESDDQFLKSCLSISTITFLHLKCIDHISERELRTCNEITVVEYITVVLHGLHQ